MQVSNVVALVGTSGRHRLEATYHYETADRAPDTVFFESDDPLCPDPNAFLMAAYPLAVRFGEKRIIMADPSSALLRDKLRDIHSWWMEWGFARPIDTLRVQLARLKRMQFGGASEKLTHEIAQLELALEELEAEAAIVSAGRPDTARADRPAPVRALPGPLPREEQRIEPEHGNCACPDCGGTLRPLGQDSDEMLDAVPVQWRVIHTIQPKYSCRSCEKVVQAAVPVRRSPGARPRSERLPMSWSPSSITTSRSIVRQR